MSSPLGLLSIIQDPILKLYKWVIDQIETHKSKRRVFTAIRDEIDDYVDKFNNLFNNSNDLVPLLDEFDKIPNKNTLNEIVILCGESFVKYADLINSYVNLSFAIKELSVNVDLMSRLRKADGFLYDFVERISDTVYEYEYVKIGREYFRFIKIYEDKVFKKSEVDDVIKTIESKYITILEKKLMPSLMIMSNRRTFRKKQIKQLYIRNLKLLSEAKNRYIIDISEEEIMGYIPKKFLPMVKLFQNLQEIEYNPTKSRRRYS